MYSGGTWYSAAMRSSESWCSPQNCTPSVMRSAVTKCSRYCHQGETFSAGRSIASMIFGCGCAAFSSARTLLRLMPSRAATSSMNAAISGRFRSKESAAAVCATTEALSTAASSSTRGGFN